MLVCARVLAAPSTAETSLTTKRCVVASTCDRLNGSREVLSLAWPLQVQIHGPLEFAWDVEAIVVRLSLPMDADLAIGTFFPAGK